MAHVPVVVRLRWVDIVITLLLALLSFFIWYPGRYEPYHWDSAGFVNLAADTLLQHNFNPFIAVGSDFSHPPLIPALLTVTKHLFPAVLPAVHLPQFFWLLFLTISAYWLGYRLSSRLVGAGTAFSLLFTPVVLAEAGIVYLDLPVAALTLTAAALWVWGRFKPAVIFLILAVLSKETALLTLPFFWLYPVKLAPRRRLFYLFLPLLVYSFYLIYHRNQTGWWLFDPEARAASRWLQSFSELVLVLQKLIRVSFFDQNRWLIGLPAVIAGIFLWSRRPSLPLHFRHQIRSVLALLAAFGLFYVIATEFAPRYLLLALPFLYLLAYALVETAFKVFNPAFASLWFWFYLLIVPVSFFWVWHPRVGSLTHYDFRPPSDLSYRDYTRIFRQLGGYLSGLETKPLILGDFPENLYLTDPSAGYVSAPLSFRQCRLQTSPLTPPAVLVIHPFSPGQVACRRLLETNPFSLIQTFTSHDRWVELYQLSASPSALPVN